MGWLNENGNEAYIANPIPVQAQQPSEETVFQNLPSDSIVRHMTREFQDMMRLFPLRNWDPDYDEEQAKILRGYPIIAYYLRNRLNPDTRFPERQDGRYQTGPKPDLSEHVMRTFGALAHCNAPTNMHFLELAPTKQGESIESYADAVHQ